MARTHSAEHKAAKEKLIDDLRRRVRNSSTVPAVAAKIGMDMHDLAAVLRNHSPVSISRLEEIGRAVGLKLVMKWE